ncbi:MAG: hypothetical protein AMXMBFR48_21150 [Ignavibacteriales bacterium]
MKTKYMNPYLAGFFLGVLLIATFYISGRGLGASGAIKAVTVHSVNVIAPEHAEQNGFYAAFNASRSGNPLRDWLVLEVLGVVIGAFISGLISDRLKLTTESGPRVKNGMRLVFAFAGGLLFSFGAQLARGCTSGAALTGMAVLSTAGFVTMMAIFGSGYAIAYFFRKLWI